MSRQKFSEIKWIAVGSFFRNTSVQAVNDLPKFTPSLRDGHDEEESAENPRGPSTFNLHTTHLMSTGTRLNTNSDSVINQ
jgi:hypothetical protein